MSDLLTQAAQELASHSDLELVLQPQSALAVAGLVQLALRHPDVSADVRAKGERLLAGVRSYFAACPAVLEILHRGDDPAHDHDPVEVVQ